MQNRMSSQMNKKCVNCSRVFMGGWNAKYCDPCNVQRKTKSLGDKK